MKQSNTNNKQTLFGIYLIPYTVLSTLHNLHSNALRSIVIICPALQRKKLECREVQ